MSQLTNHIKQLREFRGLSQAELARRLGTTSSTVSRLEAGERRLSQTYITSISQALGVEPAEIIGASASANSGAGAGVGAGDHRLIPVVGAVSDTAWAIPSTADAPQRIPVLPSPQVARLSHSGYKVLDGAGLALTGAGGYVITVPFGAMRKTPLEGDWIVLRSREGRMERHALVTGHTDAAGAYAMIDGARLDLGPVHEPVGLVVAIYREL
ncbi:helix-turn-helix domain-containing protein [Pararhodobacter oceanensis]|uniref:helix-turn-helix domain-containing protein n=1 Tax=Pararhodobacter oceanensis TaxID=2172121 RepID=UPI003A900562